MENLTTREQFTLACRYLRTMLMLDGKMLITKNKVILDALDKEKQKYSYLYHRCSYAVRVAAEQSQDNKFAPDLLINRRWLIPLCYAMTKKPLEAKCLAGVYRSRFDGGFRAFEDFDYQTLQGMGY